MAEQLVPDGTHPIVALLHHRLLHRPSFQLELRLVRDVPERLDEAFEFAVGDVPRLAPPQSLRQFRPGLLGALRLRIRLGLASAREHAREFTPLHQVHRQVPPVVRLAHPVRVYSHEKPNHIRRPSRRHRDVQRESPVAFPRSRAWAMRVGDDANRVEGSVPRREVQRQTDHGRRHARRGGVREEDFARDSEFRVRRDAVQRRHARVVDGDERVPIRAAQRANRRVGVFELGGDVHGEGSPRARHGCGLRPRSKERRPDAPRYHPAA